MRRILVAAPHPDDEWIGCGGSLLKHIRGGNPVTVVYMTSGEAGGLGRTREALAAVREAEARDAAAFAGITDLIFLGNPDGYLAYDRSNLVALVEILRRIRPDVLYIPHARETHPDHAVTHRLWVETCRRARGPWFSECPGDPWPVGTILCYEVWTPLTEIPCVEDISAFMDLKLAALRRHRSQLDGIPYDEAVAGLNRFRGITTGKGRFCECFAVQALETPSCGP